MTLRRAAIVGLLVAIPCALAACGGDGEPSMLDAHGNEARHIAGAWWVMFGLAVGVYVVVGGFIAFSVVRGRRRRGPRTSRISDTAFVWVGGIIVPALILIVLAVVTVQTTAALRKPSRHPLRVDVVARDWWWDVRYPGTGIRVANEFHLPVGRPIEMRLTSADVIHSFWVPEIGGKVDVIPGQPNTYRFTLEKTGVLRGQCAEFCGIQHANMALYVHADTPGLYERWATANATPPSEPTSEMAALGAVEFQRQACAGCHTVRGTQADGKVGPDLTNVGSRRTLGAGTVENTESNLARWIVNAQQFKPGAKMPPIPISRQTRDEIVAYLMSLR